jgi:hypothetical protein
LHDAGLRLSLAPGGKIVVSPSHRLTPDLRELVKASKAALVDGLHAVTNNPDRWCWPHGPTMTDGEIDTLAERISLLRRRGLAALDAERLGDMLVMRDRQADERRLCLECAHLASRAGTVRCAQWQRAGLGAPGVPAGMALVLQRCSSFEEQNPQDPQDPQRTNS